MYDPNLPTDFGYRDGEQPPDARLKQCPFCGSAPDIFEDGEIQCSNKKCPVRPSARWGGAEVWNTRFSPASAAPVVDDKCSCLAAGNQVAWEYVHHTSDCPVYKAGEIAKQWLLEHPQLKHSRIFEGAAAWDRETVATLLVQYAAAATAAPQDSLCLLCGHKGVAPDGTCMVPVPICSDDYHGTRRCGCKCRFRDTTAAPVEQKQPLPDHFLCINPEEQPTVINFLRGYGTDAERELARLHLNLCLRCQELANAAPVEQSDSSIPTCPDCQQGYICEHCGKSIIDYYSGNEGAR